MKIDCTHIPYSHTQSFSKLVIDYVNELEQLRPFIQAFPSREAIFNQTSNKQKQEVDRNILHDVFLKQYNGLICPKEVKENIEKLKSDNTYSICTAHQPSIFTGHLYFLYKIIHAIKLALECTKLYPEFNFIPIFYMGSEDNDIDEIGNFYYDGKTYIWETSQTGACGRMKTFELAKLVQEIKRSFNESIADEKFIMNLLQEAYHGENTLAEGTRILVDALFGKYGLLIIDGDDKELKKQFIPVIQKEIFEQQSMPLVTETIQALSTNYKIQAQPRAINLFYLKENLRERIEKSDDRWYILNTNISFSQTEMKEEINNYPERFSPNVILRPLFQECILPNVAFIGGGGELAYWLELKSVFDHHEIVYPIIFLRNSVLWLDEKIISLMDKLNLNLTDIFLKKEEIFNQLIRENETIKTLLKINLELNANYQSIISLAATISPGLEKSMLAHTAKAKRIENRILQKFKAQLKKKEELTLNKINTIQETIFPNGTLQERYLNFLTIYKIYGLAMIDILLENQQAFGNEFLVLNPVND